MGWDTVLPAPFSPRMKGKVYSQSPVPMQEVASRAQSDRNTQADILLHEFGVFAESPARYP